MIKRFLIGLFKLTLWCFLLVAAIILFRLNLFQDLFNLIEGKVVPLSSSCLMFGVVIWLHSKGEASRRQIPSIAVAMGIFFTFVGLSWSLINIVPSGIQQGTETLISGLSTAFFSSVVGLSISVGYRIYFASIEESSLQKMQSQAKQAEKIVKDFTHTIEEGINNSTRKVLEDFNRNLNRVLSQQVSNIESMNAKVTDQIESVQANLNKSNVAASELTVQVNSAVTNTTSTSEKLFDVSNRLVTVTEQFARNVEPLENQVRQISQLAPAAEYAVKVISKLSQGTEASLAQVAANLEEVTKVISAESRKSIDNFNGLFAFVDTEYKTIVGRNLQSLDLSVREGFETLPIEFRESLHQALEQYVDEVKKVVAKANGSNVVKSLDKEEELVQV